MSVSNIYEVRQRQSADPLISRSLGFFTDKTMAEQTIWACYREVWKTLMNSSFIADGEWFTQPLREAVISQGFDRWSADDWNSPAALFFVVRGQLWNQVPADLTGFRFSGGGLLG